MWIYASKVALDTSLDQIKRHLTKFPDKSFVIEPQARREEARNLAFKVGIRHGFT